MEMIVILYTPDAIIQIVTAKSMATMLSNIPLAGRGPAQIFIFDIHALQERFYFSDIVIPR